MVACLRGRFKIYAGLHKSMLTSLIKTFKIVKHMTYIASPNTKTTAGISSWLSLSWQGAFWKIMSCAAFAAINGVVRYLSGGAEFGPDTPLPGSMIMFFQNVFGTLLLFPLIWKTGISSIRHYPVLHFLRIFAAVLGIWLWYLTLQNMPIATGVALTFTGPVFTVICASIFLKERLDRQRIIAICLSLAGAFIISRPDIALFDTEQYLGWVVFFPLASALVLAWNKLITRKLANLGETPEALATYLLLFMTPVSLIPALQNWTTPSLEHWPWLFLLGLFAAIAHLSFSRAYKLAEVTFLTPFGFSKFLFSMLVGYCCFTETPSVSLFLGLGVIGLSIWLLARREKQTA